jgi:hypothetical protein
MIQLDFWYAVFITAGLVVLGGLAMGIYLLYRRGKKRAAMPAPRGACAGRAVGPLRGFARSNRFCFIAPARLARGGAFASLDALVIGYFGILGLKALGYNGEVYGSADDKQWLQVSGDGQRTPFPNPISEASADVRIIRDALSASKFRQVPVEVVCVFTNKKAQLAIPRSTGHLTVKEFKKLLQKDKYLEDTGLELGPVEEAIRAAMVK